MISGGVGADDGRRFYSTLMGPKLFDGNASVHFLMEVHPYYICPARADSSCDGDPATCAREDSGGRNGASGIYYGDPATHAVHFLTTTRSVHVLVVLS